MIKVRCSNKNVFDAVLRKKDVFRKEILYSPYVAYIFIIYKEERETKKRGKEGSWTFHGFYSPGDDRKLSRKGCSHLGRVNFSFSFSFC